MKPIEFKGQNVVFAKDQPEYQPLPAFRADTAQGEVISCWGLSWKERLRVLITGKVWLSLMSFNKPLTPSFLTTERNDVLIINEPKTKLQRYWWYISHFENWFWWKVGGFCPKCNSDAPELHTCSVCNHNRTDNKKLWQLFKEENL